jgi:hypothetical protein
MGYSVSVKARTSELAERMEAFFEREYRPYQQVWGFESGAQYSSVPSRDFSYHQGAKKNPACVGIDFNAAGFERGYVMGLGRWMTLRIGCSRKSFKDPKAKFEKPVPYIIYDVDDGWPLLVQPLDKTPKNLRWCCVDELGITLRPPLDFEIHVESKIRQEAHAKAEKKFGGPGQETHDYLLELLAPQIWGLVQPMREELKRLDRRWQESASAR